MLCGHIAEGRFISFFYCVADTDEGTLTYANAGHYPPILVRADGRVERLAVGGPVLGVFPSADYEQGRVALESGDRLVLFTDGITEVTPPGADGDNGSIRDEFGEPRLILDPDELYILATREAVRVPPDYATEMIPYDTAVGEFRILLKLSKKRGRHICFRTARREVPRASSPPANSAANALDDVAFQFDCDGGVAGHS